MKKNYTNQIITLSESILTHETSSANVIGEKARLNEESRAFVESFGENHEAMTEALNKGLKIALDTGVFGADELKVVSAKTGKETKKLVKTHNCERVVRFYKRGFEQFTENIYTLSGSTEVKVIEKTEKIEATLEQKIIALIERDERFKDRKTDATLALDVEQIVKGQIDRYSKADESIKVEIALYKAEKINLDKVAQYSAQLLDYAKKGKDLKSTTEKLATSQKTLEVTRENIAKLG